MVQAERGQDQPTKFPLVRDNTSDIEAIVAIVRRLSTAHSIAEIMEVVTQAGRSILRADGVTFVLREGDLCFYADEDAISPLWKGRRFPMSACISGWCMRERKTAVIKDIYQDPRIPQDAYKPTFVQSLVMVPVRQDDPIAAMGAYWSETRDTTSFELELFQTIANSAALAIGKIELEQEREKARRREGELAHRLKNLLAVIQALTHHTLKRSGSPEEFAEAFTGRIAALGRAQVLLTEAGDAGADLRTLIYEQLVVGANDERVICCGADVLLGPDEAFNLGLVLHELGTNARKYGCLSRDGGKLLIGWSAASDGDGRFLELSWREEGGPLVTAPTRAGFGGMLIKSSFRFDGGESRIRYEPSGLECEFRIRLR